MSLSAVLKICAVDWNEQTKAEEWRQAWADYANAFLERSNHTERIDHQSYERQGIDLVPPVRLLRFISAACIVIFLFAATAFTASYIQNSISIFYIRYLSPEEMAVADSMAEPYGSKIYFDGLKSDDVNKQYFSINKLVEYYNDEKIRKEAIHAITPLLSDEVLADENADPGSRALADAAAFALSVLKQEFDDPRIIHMADCTILFTLFNDYSDYGTYNQIWAIKDGELSVLASFDYPKMYIKQILPSPDKKLFAVTFVSNKSGYMLIWDLENGAVSPELIDSARVKIAKDLNLDYWQQIDNENYSDIHGIWEDAEAWKIGWTNNSTIEFDASLWYPGTGIDDDMFIRNTHIRYDFSQKHMEYEIIEDN